MTWRIRVQGLAISLLVLGALAVAAGDKWVTLGYFGAW